jgi:hypothetical protein
MHIIKPLALSLSLTTGTFAAITLSDVDLISPLAIPDHDPSGVIRTLIVSGLDANSRYALDLNLNIEGMSYGGFIGDLFVYLAHETDSGTYDQVVLLNRPGRSDTLPSGYDDAGLNVTLSDRAQTDIHIYPSQDYTLNANQALTGTWQPDRRESNPDTVTTEDARTGTTLDGLVNDLSPTDPNGKWTLFLADMEAGGTMQLNSWSMTLTSISPIPEPYSILATSALLASALLIRTRRNTLP